MPFAAPSQPVPKQADGCGDIGDGVVPGELVAKHAPSLDVLGRVAEVAVLQRGPIVERGSDHREALAGEAVAHLANVPD